MSAGARISLLNITCMQPIFLSVVVDQRFKLIENLLPGEVHRALR